MLGVGVFSVERLLMPLLWGAALVILAIIGVGSARAGGANPSLATGWVLLWGLVAMLATTRRVACWAGSEGSELASRAGSKSGEGRNLARRPADEPAQHDAEQDAPDQDTDQSQPGKDHALFKQEAHQRCGEQHCDGNAGARCQSAEHGVLRDHHASQQRLIRAESPQQQKFPQPRVPRAGDRADQDDEASRE